MKRSQLEHAGRLAKRHVHPRAHRHNAAVPATGAPPIAAPVIARVTSSRIMLHPPTGTGELTLHFKVVAHKTRREGAGRQVV